MTATLRRLTAALPSASAQQFVPMELPGPVVRSERVVVFDEMPLLPSLLLKGLSIPARCTTFP